MSKKSKRAHAVKEQVIAALDAMKSLSDDEKYQVALEAWCEILLHEVKAGKLSKTAASLDLMSSALSAFDGGKSHAFLRMCYPIKAWRDETVEIPKAWVRPLAEAWQAYKVAGPETTLGEVMGVEGGGQGKRPARFVMQSLKKEIRRANDVDIEIGVAAMDSQFLSKEDAIAAVAERHGISADAVKMAYNSAVGKRGGHFPK
ncbi:hypothetical protein [Paracoccus litorisediminis]|uniref:Uncharacterized protein n=1 Tax=Paracoccus litorisediminis TaxID=2006130 RepID=A0A844HI37_9RHOB|nr:hypothetical protein [Paracoccus litorisediminis]MTH57885.1 hypothetical protein [Paracoccus litorisediminis]